MEEVQSIPPWVWSYIIYPLVGIIWYQLKHRLKDQDDKIKNQSEKIDSKNQQIDSQNQQIHALNLCLVDYVKVTKFDKEIETLHKCNAALTNNFRADIKEVRADVKHANDRIDKKADKG